MDALGLQQFVHDRGQPARAVIFFAKIFSSGLHIDQERHVMANLLPVLDRELYANVPRNRVDMDRRVGRAADGRVGDDGILKSLTRKNVGGFEIFLDNFNRAKAGFVGDLSTLAVRRGDGGATRQRHAKRFGQRIHG